MVSTLDPPLKKGGIFRPGLDLLVQKIPLNPPFSKGEVRENSFN